jgi:hypothetical protein
MCSLQTKHIVNMSFSIATLQMDESIASIINLRSFEDMGISKSLYQVCELIDTNYHEMWNKHLHMGILQYYGFDSIDTFKNIYARCKLYNAIRFNPQQSIEEYLSWHSTKVRLHFGRKLIIEKQQGRIDILDFLLSMSIDELMCVGW